MKKDTTEQVKHALEEIKQGAIRIDRQDSRITNYALRLVDDALAAINRDQLEESGVSFRFVVVVLGYWGKAETIGAAAGNAFKAGGGKRNECLCYRYAGKPEDLDQITVDSQGNIEYPQAVTSKKLWSISDKVRLGKAMEMPSIYD